MATNNVRNTTPLKPDRAAELLYALQREATPATCMVTTDQIDAYVVAQLAGEGVAEAFAALTLHLPLCPTCLSIYIRLYQTLLAEKEARLAQVHPVRSFDLSFLETVAPSLVEQIQAALQQIGETISLHLSADLFRGLAPVPALAVRGQHDDHLLSLEPDETLRQTWPVTLNIYRDAGQTDLCTLKAQVKPIGRPFPQRKGIRLSVSTENNQWHAETDAYGNATLTGIPIAQVDTLKIELVL